MVFVVCAVLASAVPTAALPQQKGYVVLSDAQIGTDVDVVRLRPLLDVLGRDDKLALFTYDDELHTLVDFATPRDK